MPYVKRIVCLANSYRNHGTCIAGKELLPPGAGLWIRPVSARPSGELWLDECLYENNRKPELLDVIDVPLLSPAPDAHQIENHLIDPSKPWRKAGTFSSYDLPKIRDDPPSLWVNSDRTLAGAFNCLSQHEAISLQSSLLLIRPEDFVLKIGCTSYQGQVKRTYRGSFRFRAVHHVLQATDPDTEARFATAAEGDYPLENLHLTISLTKAFSRDHRCHKLIAAILP